MSKLTDKLVGAGEKPKLSPNPDGSGYVKQIEIVSHSGSTYYFLDGDGNTQSGSAEENVLYVENNVKFKYLSNPVVEPGTSKVIVPSGWVRVLSEPSLSGKDGGRGTPVHENTKPKVRPQVFSTPVAFQEDVFVKGKKLEDYIDSEGGVTEDEMTQYVASVLGTKIKAGDYIYDDDKFVFVNEIPDGYTGLILSIYNDGLYLDLYNEGESINSTYIGNDGVDRIQMTALTNLTHSFSELDETLQELINDAITAQSQGVACTEAQWFAIKTLLDASLYISYNGYSLMKTLSNGLDSYIFGAVGTYVGCELEFSYDDHDNKLYALLNEV